jgi:hypothetical protein
MLHIDNKYINNYDYLLIPEKFKDPIKRYKLVKNKIKPCNP